jgi:putative ABC transport system permease protein
VSLILFLKAVRSIWDNKRAYLACIVLIAVGIIVYVAMSIASSRLALAKDVYYADYRMADIFAKVQSIPQSATDSLLNIEGIEDVSLRVTHDARVDMPENDKIITMRLISYDPSVENPINGLIMTGPGFQNPTDLLTAEGFLAAHHLSVGDAITLIINGKETDFNISGTATSPEYVFIVKDINEILPDPETFSIAYLAAENMAALLNRQNEYNDVTFTLKDGYVYEDVKNALEDALDPYGLLELIPQKDQISYTMLDTEIESNRSMTTSIPFVFVFMAVVVLYLMLKRVIEQDRMQIGTMKAFGYSNAAIIGHYLFYGLITGAIGGIAGLIGGFFLADSFTALYNEYYKLPPVTGDPVMHYMLIGFLIAISGGVFGALMGAKSVVKLIPSEAMRAVAPVTTKTDVLKYLPFFRWILSSGGHMSIRSILRSKLRSAFIIIGIMFSYGMLAFMGSYWTMIDDMLMNQFTKIQLYDLCIGFESPVSYQAGLESAFAIDGVQSAEGLLEIPVEFKKAHRREGIQITGIESGATLYKIFDNDKKIYIPPSKSGVIISNSMAADLEAKTGDILTVSSPLISEDIDILVAGIVNQNLGSSCYMELGALSALFRINDKITSVVLTAEDTSYVKEFLKEGKNVGLIEDKAKTLENYNSFLASYDSIIYILEGVAIIIAFAIIYNTATISLSERKREFATLRVLGMHINEVGAILAFEYWLLCFCGIVAGVPFTMFLKQTLANVMESEMFTFPTYTPPYAYIMAAVGCMIAVFISNRSSVKNIRRFDMVEVLKERE